jgi:hypothetical protein
LDLDQWHPFALVSVSFNPLADIDTWLLAALTLTFDFDLWHWLQWDLAAYGFGITLWWLLVLA